MPPLEFSLMRSCEDSSPPTTVPFPFMGTTPVEEEAVEVGEAAKTEPAHRPSTATTTSRMTVAPSRRR